MFAYSFASQTEIAMGGISDTVKENALHLPLYHLNLNSVRLVCGDIRSRVAQECMSTDL
jgi:hypothetical protein